MDDLARLIWWLLIGLVAGWLAGRIMKTKERSLAANLLLGVIGSVLGGFLFSLLHGTIGSIVTATVGAIAVLWFVSFLNRH